MRASIPERARGRAAFAAVMLVALSAGACAGTGVTIPHVTLAGQRFEVELATDDPARARGLMFRERMADDHGMLFVYPDASLRGFWMMNTRIPLDILYFDAQARFVSAQYRVPPCAGGTRCPNYPSAGPAQYALELNAGVGEKLGLKPGDQLTLPDDIGPVR